MLEFYVGNNQISSVKELCGLKNLPKLIILDVSGNELWRDAGYRKYAIFHLKKLKVLDSVSIDQQEITEAKEMFAGRLTEEILESRSYGKKLADLKQLDLQGCKLRDFDDMFDQSVFPNLSELSVSNNNLVTLRGFGYCPRLKILTVAGNKLETLFCKPT